MQQAPKKNKENSIPIIPPPLSVSKQRQEEFDVRDESCDASVTSSISSRSKRSTLSEQRVGRNPISTSKRGGGSSTVSKTSTSRGGKMINTTPSRNRLGSSQTTQGGNLRTLSDSRNNVGRQNEGPKNRNRAALDFKNLNERKFSDGDDEGLTKANWSDENRAYNLNSDVIKPISLHQH